MAPTLARSVLRWTQVTLDAVVPMLKSHVELDRLLSKMDDSEDIECQSKNLKFSSGMHSR